MAVQNNKREKRTTSLKYSVFKSNFDRLVTRSKRVVTDLAKEAFSRGLISNHQHNEAHDDTAPADDRAAVIFRVIQDKIECDGASFDVFISILRVIPALKDLAEELVQEACPTQDDPSASEDSDSSVEKGITRSWSFPNLTSLFSNPVVPRQAATNPPGPANAFVTGMTSVFGIRRRLTRSKGKEGMTRPVQETRQGRCKPSKLGKSSNSRREVLRVALEALQNAEMDAQQQEARQCELKEEKEKLEEENRKLKELLEKKQRTENDLKKKRAELEGLARAQDMEIEALRQKRAELEGKVSRTEKDRNTQKRKSKERKKEISKIKDNYRERIENCEKEIESLQATLQQCEVTIDEHKGTITDSQKAISNLYQVIQTLEREIEKHTKESVSKMQYINSKRRAIVCHWCFGVGLVTLVLALAVVCYVLFFFMYNH